MNTKGVLKMAVFWGKEQGQQPACLEGVARGHRAFASSRVMSLALTQASGSWRRSRLGAGARKGACSVPYPCFQSLRIPQL